MARGADAELPGGQGLSGGGRREQPQLLRPRPRRSRQRRQRGLLVGLRRAQHGPGVHRSGERLGDRLLHGGHLRRLARHQRGQEGPRGQPARPEHLALSRLDLVPGDVRSRRGAVLRAVAPEHRQLRRQLQEGVGPPMQIAGQEILLPTMMVGNYPKPRWFTGQAWSEIPPGRYAADSISFEAFFDAILAIVYDQDSAGLDVITDGLMVSGDSPYAAKLYYLTERIAGFTPYGPSIMLPTYSTEHSPIVDGKLVRKCPLYSEQVRVLRKATKKPIKVNFPGLQVLAMGSINKYYSDVKDLAFDLARVYNEEFKELVAAGCDIIQLDE